MRVLLNINKKNKTLALSFGLFALLAVWVGYSSVSHSSVVLAASPGDVVINEIMYNPSTGNQNDEFLELHNTTASPIDISDWSFTQGITLTFGSGTTIAANGYLVISPSIPQTLTTYGVTAVASYAPSNLSNGGEQVTLVDESLNEIDTVTYDDEGSWPTSSDGTGPSLELKDPLLDNTLSSSWSASLMNGGTPELLNSVFDIALPTVIGLTDPNDVAANTITTIHASVTGTGVTTVELTYKLNFATDVTLSMYDDGNNGDVTAGDDIYTAQIPGQPVNSLVRYRVEATNSEGVGSAPSSDDAMLYAGYYVRDPAQTSDLEMVDWFIDDADYDDMMANHVFDDVYIHCVVVYKNEVYDNARVRIKGDITRSNDKKSLKFKLPAGSRINIDGGVNRAVSEFHMDADVFYELAEIPAAWWVVEQTGMPIPEVQSTRLQKGGEFYGLYTFIDKYQSEWRQDNGFTGDDFYEDYTDHVSGPNNTTVRDSWRDGLLLDRKDPQLRDNILDTVDLPSMFNYLSANTILGCWDHFDIFNGFLRRDVQRERWSLYFWDMDSCFTNSSDQISPYNYYSPDIGEARFMSTALYTDPEIRTLYLRRLRTLVDELAKNDVVKDKFAEIADQNSQDAALDRIAWPNYRPSNNDSIYAGLNWRTKMLDKFYQNPWGLPPSQTEEDEQLVVLDTIQADADDAEEYIKLTSSSTTPVDLSGWTIEGLDYTIPAGVVIPANGSIYFLKSDKLYKASHASVFVGGQYTTDLGGSGNLILKNKLGTSIDSGAY